MRRDQTAVPPVAGATARPAHAGRIVAFDHLRGFIIALVVLHHSVLAYCHFSHFDRRHYLWSSAPIVDDSGWRGFDVLVLFNDSFFMPLMFLISGLFVWTSLTRKGAWDYSRDRLLRLGVPFAVAVVTLVPLAYYPSFRMTGADISFGDFWVGTIFSGPWPAGPPWFIAVLLGFDLTAAGVYRLLRRQETAVAHGLSPPACFGLLIALSAVSYLPLLALFGPARWFTFGPLAVQASRVGLYAFYFLAGVEAGRRGFSSHGLLTPEGPLQRGWLRWTLAAVLLSGLLLGVQVLRLRAGLALPPFAWLGLYGLTFVLFCAAASLALPAIFLRFRRRPAALWDSLGANAYGIYIVHYPLVVWAQYALLGSHLDVILKGGLVFASALLSGWTSVGMLRRVPGVRHVI